MRIYQKYLDLLTSLSEENNEARFVAQQLLNMHQEALARDNPTILELGVDQGQSTKMFLNAIDGKTNASLTS